MGRCTLVFASICLLLASSAPTSKAQQHPSAATSSNPEVHRIALPRFQSNLPDAPGREAFAAACLTCHSTTYITMQPSLTAGKWEEVVVKMTKVYAAPIKPEEVPQIVQYVMATKEAGNQEMRESLAVTPAVKVPVFNVSWSSEQRNADLKRGEALFARNCASCHGTQGAGDGPSAASQLPPPTNLRSTRFSNDALATAVKRGVPATAMPGFPDLPDGDIRAIVSYSKRLYAPSAPAGDRHAAPEDRKQAGLLYAQNCASCHGDGGGGDGPLAATSPRPPANFQRVQPDMITARRIIADGVPATTMPPWTSKLDERQRGLLAEYVRSFYRDGLERTDN